MANITENQIELFMIDCLSEMGYQYTHGPDIAPESENPLRSNYQEVILKQKLEQAINRLNPDLSHAVKEDALKQVMHISSPELMDVNEKFHIMLTEGVNVTHHVNGYEKGETVKLIDFDNPSNNDFEVINQFTIIENNNNKRPDVILFINGLPLVVIELKNPASENATMISAYKQIQTYKAAIPTLFNYNAFVILSDGLEAKAGTISADFSRFMTWKTKDGKTQASKYEGQLEILTSGMLNQQTLLDLVRNFIVFEEDKKQDSKTGLISTKTIKKLAAYHQYYAVQKAVESVKLATAENGNRKGGVVWHTQGSGKSLSMVFTTGKLVLELNNPTVVVITDRNDLDDQLFGTFANCKQLLRQDPKQAKSRQDLKELLKVNSGGIVFTTVHKFQPEDGNNVFDELSNRKNIVVLADEAHRTQYGFKGREIDIIDEDGNKGKKTIYGFAKYMRDALPNATYLGFTGTPIEGKDINTPAVFGDYVDVYDIQDAVDDGATVKIYYESRLAKVELSEEGRKLVEQLDKDLAEEDLSDTQKAKAKWTQLEALIGSENRIKNIAQDIVNHFEQRQSVFDGKGMIVGMSRRIAVRLYDEIIKLKPEWHSDDLNKGAIKVVMTSTSSDGPEFIPHHTTKQQRRDLANRMKDVNDELKLVIVRDMWLTGFDSPSMHTLYIDKPMQGHNLMQAIARVNRVYKDKPGGLVVDYLGIASDLKKALSFYSDSNGKGNPAESQEQAVALMEEKLEVVSKMFHGFNYSEYFIASTKRKLEIILEAEEHILTLENGKKRYVDNVNSLSQAFAIAIPHDKAMDAKDEVAFFQAIKARFAKFNSTGSGRTDAEIETSIKQVIDKALVSTDVVDIFDAAGIKKPDISIMSEEFLLEVKNYKHKNIALEVLKKLLNDEISSRMKTNFVQSKTLKEMLEDSIKRYHNKVLTSAEFMDELIGISKKIVSQDKEHLDLGLEPHQYAFYTAVANNDSAIDLMGKEQLRELATVLYEKVKANTSIDWTIRENARSKIKVIVKRTLRKYGFPPDMQKMAIDNVLEQAKLLADDLTK